MWMVSWVIDSGSKKDIGSEPGSVFSFVCYINLQANKMSPVPIKGCTANEAFCIERLLGLESTQDLEYTIHR